MFRSPQPGFYTPQNQFVLQQVLFLIDAPDAKIALIPLVRFFSPKEAYLSYSLPFTSLLIIHNKKQQFPVNSNVLPFKPPSVAQRKMNIIEQPLQVVDLKQYEAMWNKRLEELQNGKPAPSEPTIQFQEKVVEKEKVVIQEDTTKIKQLQAEIEKLKGQLKDYEANQGNAENNLNYYKRLVQELQNNLSDAGKTIQEKNDQLSQLEGQMDDLNEELQTAQNHLSQKVEEISHLQKELSNSNSAIQKLNGQIAQQATELGNKQMEIDRLLALLAQRDQTIAERDQDLVQLDQNSLQLSLKQREIDDLNSQLDELRAELDQNAAQSEEYETRTTHLTNEIGTWKQRFIELNREFHTTQEGYMLCQAELENLKKGGVKTTQVTSEVKRSTVPRASVRVGGPTGSSPNRGSDYQQSALNESDQAKLDELTKK